MTTFTLNGDHHARVGVFVDLENVCGIDLERIGEFASKFGRVTIKRVYMPGYKWRMAKQAKVLGFQPVLVAGIRKQSAVDAEMMVDMMDEALRDHVSTLIVASGDADFEAAVRRLREIGKYVAVYSEKKSLSKSLLSSADHVEIFGKNSRSQVNVSRQDLETGSEIDCE